MADSALNPQETEDQPIVDLDDASAGSEEAKVEAQAETVIEESDSQSGRPKTGSGYNRLIRRLQTAKQDTKETSAALEAANAKAQMLELALQQERESKANVLPNPADFDEGVADPAYIKAQQDHTESLVEKALRKHAANTPVKSAGNVDLDRLQRAHSERAEKLNIADYADVQDSAIDILGLNTVNQIIAGSDRSEVILYHLGKNPERAEDIRALVDTNPVKATLEIGRLEERLKVKPRAATQPIPDPDVEVQGGTPTAGQNNKFEKQLDKAREAVQAGTGSMRAVLEIKKTAKEAGVTLK